MRTAIVSDIHGNLTAFEAVLADLRETAPDLILHGGDLGDNGSSPCEVVDRIRDLGWQGVVGNTDEMLFDPESLTRFASGLPQLKSLFDTIEEMAAAARERWARNGWPGCALCRASKCTSISRWCTPVPDTAWRAPMDSAADGDLESAYGPLGRPVVVYGHIHRPYVRRISGVVVANSGSVGLPHDGDRRASYLLLDDGEPSIRRVEYDVDRELKALRAARAAPRRLGRAHSGERQPADAVTRSTPAPPVARRRSCRTRI
jgi:predicted phosphodiesterase